MKRARPLSPEAREKAIAAARKAFFDAILARGPKRPGANWKLPSASDPFSVAPEDIEALMQERGVSQLEACRLTGERIAAANPRMMIARGAYKLKVGTLDRNKLGEIVRDRLRARIKLEARWAEIERQNAPIKARVSQYKGMSLGEAFEAMIRDTK